MRAYFAAALMLMACAAPAEGQDATLRTGDFAAYQASMAAMSEAVGATEAQRAAIALMTLAWQSTAPDVAFADWTKAMAQDQVAWLAAIKAYEGMSAGQLLAAREALPPFKLWP